MRMAAADVTATAMQLEFAPRIPLGHELRLRDMPGLIAAIRRGVQGGAHRIELDASSLQRITEGARLLIEAAMVHASAHGAEVCWLDAPRGRPSVHGP